ncbi:MAG: hypothetical protein V1747_01225 [Candidatus Omnitrophota bacterium]
MRRKLFVLLVLSFVICVGFSNLYADEVVINQDTKIDKNVDYNVCYEINENEIDVAGKVRIEGYYIIGDKVFLMVSGSGFKGKEMRGYILLDSVKSILPTDGIVPMRTVISDK